MKPRDTDKKPAKPDEAAPTAPVVEEKIDFSNVQIEPLLKDFVDFATPMNIITYFGQCREGELQQITQLLKH